VPHNALKPTGSDEPRATQSSLAPPSATGVPPAESEWSDAWYRVFMQISAISFVIVDARRRVRRAKELKAAGVTNLLEHLKESPEDLAIIRNGAVILDLNDTAVRVFGGTAKAEFVGQSTDRFFARDCTALGNVSDAYVQGQREFQQQASTLRLDGTPFDSLFCVVLNVPRAEDGIWLAGFIDITEELRHRAVTEALRDELAHVSRISLLGELSASIAHELGQPLGAIGMTARTVLNIIDRAEPDLQAIRGATERISLQATRAGEVIGRVRGMAARRPGRTSLVPIGELLREAVRFVRHELERDAIALSIGIDDEDAHVAVDRIQIQQLLVNLIMNAIQIMRDHGTEAPAISLNGRHEGGRLVLDVRDTGPGISDEDLPLVFKSFFTSRSDGLGLGLSICKTIVEAHGGTISATNRTDRPGAVFVIEMPLPTGG
jgi:two-component system sensor kinase FixL